MSNFSQYKAMMGEVHASADLIGKVKGIPMEKTKKRTTALKFGTATCAALLGDGLTRLRREAMRDVLMGISLRCMT